MERNLNKALHIEFYGLPGCGKSTVSHILADKLREKGLNVSEPSYDYDHKIKPLKRKAIKLRQATEYLLLNRKQAKAMRGIVSENGYKGIRSAFPQIVNLTQKLRIYENAEDMHIYIWDQGIIQASASLSVTGKVHINDNIDSLLKLLPVGVNIKPVYIKESISTVKARMETRETNDSRVEKIQDEREKDILLRIWEANIDSIDIKDKTVFDNTGMSAAGLANEILKRLKQEGKIS